MFKKSMVVAPPSAEFEAVVREPLEEALKVLHELGFEGVELSILDPTRLNLKELESVLEEYGLEVPALSTGLNYIHYGFSLSSPNLEKRRAAVSRLKEFVDLGEALGAGVIVGLMRGRLEEGISKDKAYGHMVRGLREVCSYAENRGVKVFFEPLNRYETQLVNTVDEAIELRKKVGTSALYLLLDTFHMNIEEPIIEDSIIKARGLIGHVHVADSNRYAPGMGHIDFKSILDALREAGYQGYLSAEIVIKPDFRSAAKTTLETLKKAEKEIFKSS
ncbi:MAG: sugar phosphate isomerase/epimerase [Thermoprotei archaeon]|nr:MAG: sugar phosphate isomerase/epimerase [Thermoprotei archaeon]